MMPESVTSLKKSNRELKKQLNEAKQDLKKLEKRVSVQERLANSTVTGEASAAILNIEAEKSLEFLSHEYDDSRVELERILLSLKNIEERLYYFGSTLDELQDYSYSFNVKVKGVPEVVDTENALETSKLVVRLFNVMGAQVSLNDIDIAHRVPFRDSKRKDPKPIVCKFTRRLARNKVMAVRKEADKIAAIDMGFDDGVDISNIRVVDHLSQRLQKLFANAKAHKDRYQYAFCWVKNGTIFLRKFADSRPLRIKDADQLGELAQEEQAMLI